MVNSPKKTISSPQHQVNHSLINGSPLASSHALQHLHHPVSFTGRVSDGQRTGKRILPDITAWTTPHRKKETVQQRMRKAAALDTEEKFELEDPSPLTNRQKLLLAKSAPPGGSLNSTGRFSGAKGMSTTSLNPTRKQTPSSVVAKVADRMKARKKKFELPPIARTPQPTVTTHTLPPGAPRSHSMMMEEYQQELFHHHGCGGDSSDDGEDADIAMGMDGNLHSVMSAPFYSPEILRAQREMMAQHRELDEAKEKKEFVSATKSSTLGEACKKELESFEDSMQKKLEYGAFLAENKPAVVAAMMVKYFRFQMVENFALIEKIRKVPLSSIEDTTKPYTAKAVMFPVFLKMLKEILGPNEPFSEVEAEELFDFFDTDSDGDIDYKEMCNGFVAVRTVDGAMMPVLYRCQSFGDTSIKNTTLTFISRFELVLMADALTQVSTGYVKDARDEAEKFEKKNRSLLKEYDDLVDAYNNPRTGPREYVSPQHKRELANTKQKLTQLRREYNSKVCHHDQLSDELERLLAQFACNRKGKFPFNDIRDAVQSYEATLETIQTLSVPRDPELHDSPISQFIRTLDAEEGEQPFKLMKSNRAVALSKMMMDTAAYKLEKKRNRQHHKAPPRTMNGRPPSVVEQTTSVAVTPADKSLRPTPELEFEPRSADTEPGEPEYYTFKGILYLKLKGQEPQAHFVEGMPTNIRYSGEDAQPKKSLADLKREGWDKKQKQKLDALQKPRVPTFEEIPVVEEEETLW